MDEKTKEPETGNENNGTASNTFERITYRLKPHNVRTFSDLQEVLEMMDLRYYHFKGKGEDPAAKSPHLWERDE